jgi:hypothetical protein
MSLIPMSCRRLILKFLNRLSIGPETVADLDREPVDGDPIVGVRMPKADVSVLSYLKLPSTDKFGVSLVLDAFCP